MQKVAKQRIELFCSETLNKFAEETLLALGEKFCDLQHFMGLML